MSDQGNAVTAEWAGPSGFQLFDGTTLTPGTIVEGVGFDEATHNPYWKIVRGKSTADPATVLTHRTDASFATEEGGGGTGRPAPVKPELVATEVAA